VGARRALDVYLPSPLVGEGLGERGENARGKFAPLPNPFAFASLGLVGSSTAIGSG
jgi:hypothetical protein